MTDVGFLDLPDLAAEAVGGAAIQCTDEFFSAKDALVRDCAPAQDEGRVTDRGKWMDGWETRRRRAPGHDSCVIRLGLPGVIRGVVIDTTHVRSTCPEQASLEACVVDGPLDLEELERAEWTEILPRAALLEDRKNEFAIAADRRFTHVRLNIFPDGGVARLRVHGEVVPRWARLRGHGGLVELAALANGALVEACSDERAGSHPNLIRPGAARGRAEGWQPQRRRGGGPDWVIVRLCAPGTVERLELDTRHFKGDAPERCLVEGIDAHLTPAVEVPAMDGWRPLLASALQPDTVHVFEPELRRVGRISHVRLSLLPDGGLSRLRAWGRLDGDPAPGIERLNGLDLSGARAALRRCCGSTAWVEAMVVRRPFEDQAALLRIAERVFWEVGEQAWLEAFLTLPRLGGHLGGHVGGHLGGHLRDGDGEAGAFAWSSEEQRGLSRDDPGLLDELAAANQAYVDRFGFVFLLCATGLGGAEMLAELKRRISRPRDEELRTAAEEQLQVTRLRLLKLVEELS